MPASKSRARVLSVFSLVMINVIAVDSLRTLPIAAEYGSSLIFFYLLAALVFFLPTAFVTAELATAWPELGGLYVWVKQAFGPRWGFLVIWLQWIYNVVWYPTIMSFVATMIAYMIDPALAANKTYMVCLLLVLFWGATFLNFFGMRFSSFISTIGSLFGTLLPMGFIIGLGGYWIATQHPVHIDLSWHGFMPKIHSLPQLVLFGGILYGLVGLEMSAVHAREVRHPESDYPRALIWSVGIILFTLMLASLAVAIVVPKSDLSLVAGIMQAFEYFFKALHMSFLIPVIAFLMMLGGLSSVTTWIIGPTKGLLAAAEEGDIPAVFATTNRYGVPVVILIAQAVIYSLLVLVYFLMPSVNASYWLLTEMTAQLALLMYVILFASAIVLRYVKADVPRPYRIPGGNWLMWMIAGIGLLTCVVMIFIGFIPPGEVDVGDLWRYEALLIGGFLLFFAIPLVISRR